MSRNKNSTKPPALKSGGDKRKYIGLARVSSREQEREGFSLDTQEQEIRRYVEKERGELVRIWRVAETATRSVERATFRELVDYAKAHAHELAGMVFAKIDRAARNLTDYVELERLESEYGIPFISVTQHFENTPTGRFGRRLTASSAAFFTEQMSVDIRKGQAKRAENGLPHGRPNYGYHLVRREGRNVLEPHPENAKKVQRMFQLYAYSNLSLDGVRQKLKEEGITFTEKQPKWHLGHLHTMLQNRFYIGEVKYNDQWFPGHHKPLIDRETWDRVQTMLGNKSQTVLNFTYGDGLIRCGHCGCAVLGEQIIKKKSQKKYRYYRCSQYRRAEGHPQDRVTEADLDQQVLAMFERLRLEDPAVRELFAKTLRAKTLEDRQEAKAAVGEATRQLNLLTNQKDRLTDMRMAGEIDADEFLERKTRMRDEEARLQLQLDKTNKNREEVVDLALRTLELSQSLKNKWVQADFDVRAKLLRATCSNFTLVGVTLVPEMRKPFDVLAEGPHGDKSGAKESRTPDLFVANEALYQLSYRPIVLRPSSDTHESRSVRTSTS